MRSHFENMSSGEILRRVCEMDLRSGVCRDALVPRHDPIVGTLLAPLFGAFGIQAGSFAATFLTSLATTAAVGGIQILGRER